MRFSIAQQIERAAAFVDPYNLEVHGLQIAIDAGGLQTCGTKLLGHVAGGLLKAAAAGVSAFKTVIGQKLNVGPPAFAQRVPVLRESGASSKSQGKAGKQTVTWFHARTPPKLFYCEPDSKERR